MLSHRTRVCDLHRCAISSPRRWRRNVHVSAHRLLQQSALQRLRLQQRRSASFATTPSLPRHRMFAASKRHRNTEYQQHHFTQPQHSLSHSAVCRDMYLPFNVQFVWVEQLIVAQNSCYWAYYSHNYALPYPSCPSYGITSPKKLIADTIIPFFYIAQESTCAIGIMEWQHIQWRCTPFAAHHSQSTQ